MSKFPSVSRASSLSINLFCLYCPCYVDPEHLHDCLYILKLLLCPVLYCFFYIIHYSSWLLSFLFLRTSLLYFFNFNSFSDSYTTLSFIQTMWRDPFRSYSTLFSLFSCLASQRVSSHVLLCLWSSSDS